MSFSTLVPDHADTQLRLGGASNKAQLCQRQGASRNKTNNVANIHADVQHTDLTQLVGDAVSKRDSFVDMSIVHNVVHS